MPLLNSQYDSIMLHYDAIREEHRHELEDHIAEIDEKLPSYRVLSNEYAHVASEIGRTRLLTPSADTTPLKERLDFLKKEKKNLLIRNGYSSDYLDLKYTCNLCHDTGYINGEKCRCFKAAAVELLYKQYSLDDILKEENFEHFQIELYSDTIRDGSSGVTPRMRAEEALAKALKFSRDIGQKDNNLLIMGKAGTGKTFLTHCIADYAIRGSHSTLYFTAYDFFNLMGNVVMNHSDEAASYDHLVLECDLLILDDLGVEMTNTLVESEFFRIINERHRRNLSTVISTNLNLNEISQRYTERIFSRLITQSEIIELIGDDIRLKKKI